MAAVLAGLVAVSGAGRAQCPPALGLTDPRQGTEFERIALPGGRFTLSYRHSVTLTPVVERYRVENGVIHQITEEFQEHGPGLSHQADPGGTWRRENGRFILDMHRPLPRLVVRVDPDYANRLTVDGRETDLTRWGRRALDFTLVCGSAP